MQSRASDALIVLIREELEVHVYAVEYGGHLLEGIFAYKPAGHKDIFESLRSGQPRGIIGQLVEDGGLRVGIGD